MPARLPSTSSARPAPWFILAIMLLAYAVRSIYIESCSMFVRGGVYRVVKEAMGGTLAKFSVSALMFDYILTGPISGVSAGLYLVGLLNELLHYFHLHFDPAGQLHRGRLCRPGHDLFLVGKHQGHPRIQRKSPAHHVRDHGDGGRDDRLVRLHALGARRSSPAVAAARRILSTPRRAGLAAPHHRCRTPSD